MKHLKHIAILLSNIFHPTFYPLVGFILLFTLTYLGMLPWFFKLWVFVAVYVFTIALPYVILLGVRKANGWRHIDMYRQHRRSIVYLTNILCYASCMYVCSSLYLPTFIGSILVVCIMAQCACALVNIWYKVSMHSAGTGLLIGALLAYSFLFNFNPTWWLCIALLISGAVMSSRMYLYHRELGQVLVGTAIGIFCGFAGIILW